MEPVTIALFLVVAFPLAWLVSEFWDNRGIRIVLGVLAISMSFFVAFVAGSLKSFQYNIYFGDTSKKLIDTTVAQLDAGESDEVLRQLITLQAEYHPTYENRANYKELVDAYASHFNGEQIDNTEE